MPASTSPRSRATRLFEGEKSDGDQQQKKEQPSGDSDIERTSFDQAGRSLIEEEDQQRMEQMGDFDLNPDVRRQRCFAVLPTSFRINWGIYLTLLSFVSSLD